MTPDSTVRVTATTITLPVNFPANPRPAQLDAVMAQIGAALNMDLGAVKLGGRWVIGTKSPKWSPISDTAHLRRQFTGALADALGRTVIVNESL